MSGVTVERLANRSDRRKRKEKEAKIRRAVIGKELEGQRQEEGRGSEEGAGGCSNQAVLGACRFTFRALPGGTCLVPLQRSDTTPIPSREIGLLRMTKTTRERGESNLQGRNDGLAASWRERLLDA